MSRRPMIERELLLRFARANGIPIAICRATLVWPRHLCVGDGDDRKPCVHLDDAWMEVARRTRARSRGGAA